MSCAVGHDCGRSAAEGNSVLALLDAPDADRAAAHLPRRRRCGAQGQHAAEGQSRRIDILGAEITRLDNWQAPEFSMDDEIYLGALIELAHTDTDERLHVFLAPAGGGQKVEGLTLHVITPDAPLAASVLGKCVGDMVKLPNGQAYEIIDLN